MRKTAELWQRVLDTDGCKKAKALTRLQNHLWSHEHFVESIAVTQEIRDLYKQLEDSRLWLHYSWVAALRYSACDRLDEACAVISESLPTARERGDDYYIGLISLLDGEICSKLGKFGDAEIAFKDASQHFEKNGDWVLCGEAQHNLGRLNQNQGHTLFAVTNYSDSITFYGQANSPTKVLEVRIEMAELLSKNAEISDAINVLAEALPVARFLEDRLAEQKVLRRLGVAHSEKGDADLAELLLKKAAAMKGRGLHDQEAALAMESLAQHHERFGDSEKAQRQSNRVSPVKQALGLGGNGSIEQTPIM